MGNKTPKKHGKQITHTITEFFVKYAKKLNVYKTRNKHFSFATTSINGYFKILT